MIEDVGTDPCASTNRMHSPMTHDRRTYARRHEIDTLWAGFEEWRAIATRYDRAAVSGDGTLYIVAIMDRSANRA